MRHPGAYACAFVLVAGLLVSGDLGAGSLEPPGPPAPTMKTIREVEPRTPITSLPFTITAPGNYYLTGDLVGVSGQNGITLQASYVTIDLNGFSLVGVAGSGSGIFNLVAGVKNVAIRHGTIRNWGSHGVLAHNVTDMHVEDLRVASNAGGGIFVGANSVVSAVTATGNGGSAGISANSGSTISKCTASGNAGYGIFGWTQSTVSDSTAGGNGNYGINLEYGATANDCTASNNPVGIYLNVGARVSDSVASVNGIGIVAEEGTTIEECNVDGNDDDGIQVFGRAVVRGNFARGNTNDGIQALGSGSRIEENESAENGVGIRVGNISNLIVKNSVYNNATEYSIVAGNQLGPISTNPGTAGPWANFDL